MSVWKTDVLLIVAALFWGVSLREAMLGKLLFTPWRWHISREGRPLLFWCMVGAQNLVCGYITFSLVIDLLRRWRGQ